MIELLLQAERCLTTGLVDQAERLYLQAAQADARNSIAVVGLARVALERGDDAEALRQARRALLVDPQNVAAGRLAARLDEVLAARRQPLPPMDEGEPEAATATESGPETQPESGPETQPDAEPETQPEAETATPSRRTGLGRLLRRNRP